MSDSNTAVLNTVAYINITKPEARRVQCVSAALELINSSVSAAGNRNTLEHEMANLSKYADLIEAAINKQ